MPFMLLTAIFILLQYNLINPNQIINQLATIRYSDESYQKY